MNLVRNIISPSNSRRIFPYKNQQFRRAFSLASLPLSSDFKRKVFCNVELNGELIEAIGFDMDFTLAQYNAEFDKLAFYGALEKLHKNFNYPADILKLTYKRGLIIDKSKGNILKVDKHKYVVKACHGYEEMHAQDRKAEYNHEVHSFNESNYASLDTLFMVVDASLFSHLVDYKDRHPHTIRKSYDQIHHDVRASVDQCHLDGTIKEAVMKNPAKYIRFDEGFVPMMKHFREYNKKLFLLTNSLWEYTNVVMNYLVSGNSTNNADWCKLFDIVIVGGCKPAFLTDSHLSLLRIDTNNGSLCNIEDKSELKSVCRLQKGGICRNVFQGGHWKDLHTMLNVSSGDKVLYVGDHMFADIVRSKKTLGWRTVLIIPELEDELENATKTNYFGKLWLRLRKMQQEISEEIDVLWHRKHRGEDVSKELAAASQKAQELQLTVKKVNDEYHRQYNPVWGQLLKAGFQDSRFGKQVTDFADLYTSRATNLGLVAPTRSFQPLPDFMSHDRDLVTLEDFDFDESVDLRVGAQGKQ